MKKTITLILVLALCLILVSCSSQESTSSNTPNDNLSSSVGNETSSESDAKDSGKITLGSAELSVGMTVTDALIEKVGEPEDILNAPSCFFDGEDTIYVYSDFSLYTYRDGDKDVLYIIELSSDKHKTALGGAVGMEISAIEEIYGYDSMGTATSKVFSTGENSKIRFTYDENETVTLIEYELIG